MSKGHEKFINLSPDQLADLHHGRMSTGSVYVTLGFGKAAEDAERVIKSSMLRRTFG